MTRSLHRLVLAALLVPLALVIGLRSAWATYACRVDRVTRSACCCEGHHARKRPAPAQPRVSASSCCDVTVDASPRAPDVRDADRSELPPPTLVLAPAFVDPPTQVAPRVITIERTAARPPPVATFLIKQSFLR